MSKKLILKVISVIIFFFSSALYGISIQVEQSLVSFSSGALVIHQSSAYSEDWGGQWINDENPHTGWCCAEGQIFDNILIIELAEETILERLEFDTAYVDTDGSAAKNVTVAISNNNTNEGFQEIARVTLVNQQNNQDFPVEHNKSGRWLKLTIEDNYSSNEYTELMDFRAYGKQLTNTPLPDVSGTYETSYNDFHLRQEGSSITGCYEYNEGVLTGGIEGRIMKFTWKENVHQGPAVMVFTSDGRRFYGFWWYEGEDTNVTQGKIWDGTKISSEVGGCPHWSGGIQEQMTKDLLESGRIRLYGINFDYDSDVIREESRPILDKIVTLLNSELNLCIVIEGHTDSVGSSEHNLLLSQKRAESVKNYLVSEGIGSIRLFTEGYGESIPVASNATFTGRAQNRRVELVVKK